MPLPVLRRSEVSQLIALGHLLVVHRNTIYRLNTWASRHPGGALSILHFVGRDASNEIEAYHCDATLNGVMKSFVVAQVHPQDWMESGAGWKPLTPPVQLGTHGEYGRLEDYASATGRKWKDDLQAIRTSEGSKMLEPHYILHPTRLEPPEPPAEVDPVKQNQIARGWERLHEQIKLSGAYEAKPFWHYRIEMLRYFGLFAGFLYVFLNATQTWHYYLAAVLLGACWHQVTFVVHDAGHAELTGNYHLDRTIGCLIAAWFGGLSCGWWCDNHNIHHLVTNHPEHDPDIQHVPFFAISTKFLGNLYSTYYRRTMLIDAACRFFLPMQHKLYYIIMSLGRFNLFANSYEFLLFKAKRGFYRNLELVGVVFFWAWFGGGVLRSIPSWTTRLGFVLVSFIVTSPLHVQIVLSHFAQSTEDLGIYESFPARQIRTTMDVSCPEYIAWIHGGLNMQVTHHLFPRIPRHNLPAATHLIKQFAQEQGLEYQIFSFIKGNGRVLDVLRDVANQVSILGKVAEAQARGEIHSH